VTNIEFTTVGGALVTVTHRLLSLGHGWNCAGCKTKKRPDHRGEPGGHDGFGKPRPRTRDEATTEANTHAAQCRATPRH